MTTQLAPRTMAQELPYWLMPAICILGFKTYNLVRGVLAGLPCQRTCCMSMGAVQQSTMRVVTPTLSAHSFSRCSAAWTQNNQSASSSKHCALRSKGKKVHAAASDAQELPHAEDMPSREVFKVI